MPRQYKVVKLTTNHGKTFYGIKYSVTILFFITYWEIHTYDDDKTPVEYETIEDAHNDIALFKSNEKAKKEKIISCIDVV